MASDKTGGPPFKVIIVGGGVSGLTLANCLRKANIDYIILERGNVLQPVGSALFINSASVRILHQVGLLERGFELGTIPTGMVDIGPGGKTLVATPNFRQHVAALGYPMLAFMRNTIISILYEGLGADAATRVRNNVKPAAIDEHEHGVRVTLEDGSVVEGSIVVAADGVRSGVRRILASQHEDGRPNRLAGEDRFTSQRYKVLYGKGVSPPSLGDTFGKFIDVHGPGFLMQYAVLKDLKTCGWTLYEYHPELAGSGRRFLDKGDTETILARYDDVVVANNGTTFSDLVKNSGSFGDVLDEGTADRWYSSRVVCIGESASKANPVLGQGANMTFRQAAYLANHLNELVNNRCDGGGGGGGEGEERERRPPTTDQLRRAFDDYERYCKPFAKRISDMSTEFLNFKAWISPAERSKDTRRRWLVSFPPFFNYLDKRFLTMIGTAPCLDFTQPEGGTLTGFIGWSFKSPTRDFDYDHDAPPEPEPADKADGWSWPWATCSLLVAATAAAGFALRAYPDAVLQARSLLAAA